MDWAAVQCGIKVRYHVTMAAGKVAVNWIQLCYNLQTVTCAFLPILRDGNFPTRIVSLKSLKNRMIFSHTSDTLEVGKDRTWDGPKWV